jgi:hypothetical protein
MSASQSQRFAGPVAVVAGVLVVVTQVISTLVVDASDVVRSAHKTSVLVNSVAVVAAFCLLAVALLALYLAHQDAFAGFGLAAVVVALIGTMLMLGDLWFEAFAVPWLADAAPGAVRAGAGGRLVAGAVASFVIFAVGWALVGVASWRARCYPRPASALLVVGGLLGFRAATPPYGVLLGLAVLWLGLAESTWGKSGRPPTARE